MREAHQKKDYKGSPRFTVTQLPAPATNTLTSANQMYGNLTSFLLPEGPSSQDLGDLFILSDTTLSNIGCFLQENCIAMLLVPLSPSKRSWSCQGLLCAIFSYLQLIPPSFLLPALPSSAMYVSVYLST